ncbi:hypothetical protein Taro_022731 [Colocasia esculenta]|uniref:Aminotransferase-like plant mobile domain-containing protein n=1 Tax=Colocasia esculenta TaxID=4460 RepID=A0A843V2Q3_COLES|nr:hypothetical protein [Colocasia esculenta]
MEEEEEMTGDENLGEEEFDPAAMDAGGSASEGEETAGSDGEREEETEVEAPRRTPRRLKGKGIMRSRVTWDLCWAWYRALSEAQQTHIAQMGFEHLLAMRPFHVDVPYLEALRERWDEDYKAFIMPWGHMIPTLEDVAYLTGLLIRSILLGSLSESVGLRGGRRGALETQEEFCAGVWRSIQLGGRSEEQLVLIFVAYLFGRLLFPTQPSQMNCKFIWGYTRFPMKCDVQTEGNQAMVPLMARWEVAPDPRVTDRRVEDLQAGLDLYPHDQVVWTPYLGEAYAAHPAVAAGRPLFNCHVLLLCLGTCEPFFLELVVWILGWNQPTLELPSLGREGHSRRRFFAEDRDWSVEHGNTLAYWRGGGEQVLQHPDLQDSSVYLEDYRMPESEAVRLLEGRLAEQAVETKRLRAETLSLREELARVWVSRDTGASSSTQPPSGDLAVRLQGALD